MVRVRVKKVFETANRSKGKKVKGEESATLHEFFFYPNRIVATIKVFMEFMY